MVVIDGTGLVFGRLASKIAKLLLEGNEVHLINSENILISGDPKVIIEKYQSRRRLKNKQDPEKSPKWSRVPHLLVKRMIRGMLPRKKKKGRIALKMLKVYTSNPKAFKDIISYEEAKPKNIKKYITIKDLCYNLGWRGE